MGVNEVFMQNTVFHCFLQCLKSLLLFVARSHSDQEHDNVKYFDNQTQIVMLPYGHCGINAIIPLFSIFKTLPPVSHVFSACAKLMSSDCLACDYIIHMCFRTCKTHIMKNQWLPAADNWISV